MLYQLIKPYASVSIIGMCKNAGKTTAFNAIIRACLKRGEILGLTSAGRDGERNDLVTNTEKPGIFVYEGVLAATAEQTLYLSAVSREIVGTTGIPTPMGEIILIRAKSDGFIQLAGPSATGGLIRVRDMLFSLGANRVLIDGAVSRKSLAGPSVGSAAVLCVGASYSADMYKTVFDTAHAVRLLELPETERALPALTEKYTLFTENETFSLPELCGAADRIRGGGIKAIAIRGGVTDAIINRLLETGRALLGLELIAEDASRLLICGSSAEKLSRAGVYIRVKTGTKLTAVTVNPFSAYGSHYDKNAFIDAVRKEIPLNIPVMDMFDLSEETEC